MKILYRIKKKLGRLLGRFRVVRYPYLFIKSMIKYGPVYTIQKIKKRFHKENFFDSIAFERMQLSSEMIVKQKNMKFHNQPCISILVPLYNTPKLFLEEMIASMLSQTYQNWELILADGSDQMDLKEFIPNDQRVKYIKLPENKGIVENTNAAYKYASGEYIGLLDHDDCLACNCLFEVAKAINEGAQMIYTDEVTFKKDVFKDAFQPNLKPDFSWDTLRSYNYICHFFCFQASLLEDKEELLNKDMEGSQDYDLILRISERAKQITHISKILYFWRAHEHSTAQSIEAKPYTMDAAKRALSAHLKRVGLKGTVLDNSIPTTYKINYDIIGKPKVSILIPNKDHKADLSVCVKSILKKSTYENYEIIIIENNSIEDETFVCYKELESLGVKIVTYQGNFNYSKINNYGESFASGDYLILLNNDVEVITPSWIEEMLMYAQREDVGCVGCRLLYKDDTIQHAGVVVGIGSVAGHAHKYLHKDAYGFMSRLQIVQNMSAVTAACLMINKADYEAVDGLDEGFQVAFNDIDFCLRINRLGKLNVFTPFSELYHYESKSRGAEDSEEKVKRFQSEIKRFESKWGLWLTDPYYNDQLTLLKEDFSLKMKSESYS